MHSLGKLFSTFMNRLDRAVVALVAALISEAVREPGPRDAHPDEVPCPSCGTTIPRESRFCTECGGRVTTAPQGPQQQRTSMEGHPVRRFFRLLYWFLLGLSFWIVLPFVLILVTWIVVGLLSRWLPPLRYVVLPAAFIAAPLIGFIVGFIAFVVIVSHGWYEVMQPTGTASPTVRWLASLGRRLLEFIRHLLRAN